LLPPARSTPAGFGVELREKRKHKAGGGDNRAVGDKGFGHGSALPCCGAKPRRGAADQLP